ncbi:junctional adhesion molecule B-like isoform X1 [Scyliorhinus canicula]|uniref:junctional adhesion molecule B-like isoform X1 n=1 Tax=Scyliorhinus canicula TaxID=7830 RepID=UPI0018F4F8A8|nr:junctional adhesion molecule B-like isoform X1 [Scyliorhinus canicula]
MTRVEIFLCSFSLLQLIHQSHGVTITSLHRNVEVKEFETAQLSCNYQVESDHARLEWKKIVGNQVSFVYFNGLLMEKYRGRAEMRGSSIRLRDVTREDMATYRCEVAAAGDKVDFAEIDIKLSVLVPPAVPTCKIPSSAMSGSRVVLTCKESDGSPPSDYTWFKDNKKLLERPAKDLAYINTSYTVNQKTGVLTFNPVKKTNSGSYHCEAKNKAGGPQKCSAQYMQINDLDVGAIVITVIIIASVLSLCGFGMYYAHRKGYLGSSRPSKGKGTNHTTVPPVKEDFKHTKSFII